jgi:hypothetical protein
MIQHGSDKQMTKNIGHMRLGWLVGLAALATTPALAGTYTLTITNASPERRVLDVRSVKVKGATPDTYPLPGTEPRTFSIEVTMPKGLCKTRVSVFFLTGVGRVPGGRSDINYDVCSEAGITIR